MTADAVARRTSGTTTRDRDSVTIEPIVCRGRTRIVVSSTHMSEVYEETSWDVFVILSAAKDLK